MTVWHKLSGAQSTNPGETSYKHKDAIVISLPGSTFVVEQASHKLTNLILYTGPVGEGGGGNCLCSLSFVSFGQL